MSEEEAVEPKQVEAPTASAESPVWRWDAFAGEFCDAFIKSTGLEGAASSAASIDELVGVTREVLASENGDAPALLTKEDVAKVEAICVDLTLAATIDRQRMQVRDAASMQQFLVFFTGELSSLAPGERLAWGGGWMDKGGGHALMFAAERSAVDSADAGGSFSLVVCNTGEGVEYHPSKEEYPKTKSRTAIRIGDIPRDAFLDQGVWYTFFKINCFAEDDHGPEMMYEVILPHLCSMVPLSSTGTKAVLQHAWLESAATGADTLFSETKAVLTRDKEKLLSTLEDGEIQGMLEAGGAAIRYRIVLPIQVALRSRPALSARTKEDISIALGEYIVVSEVVDSTDTSDTTKFLKLADGSGYYPLGPPANPTEIEVLSPSKKWRVCTIVDSDSTRIKIHYNGFEDTHDEWLEQDSPRLRREQPYFRKVASNEDGAAALEILKKIPGVLDCSAGTEGLSVEAVAARLEGKVVGLYIAAGGAVQKGGHTGEYRDIQSGIRMYCSSAVAPEGKICEHKPHGEVIHNSHWSCCGAKGRDDKCLNCPPDDDEWASLCGPQTVDDDRWSCASCTFENIGKQSSTTVCEMCGTPCPAPAGADEAAAVGRELIIQSNFCRSLASTYAKLREGGEGGSDRVGFEVVFLSNDSDSDAFDAHVMGTGPQSKRNSKPMPWLALPHADREHVSELLKLLDLEGDTDHLLLFAPDGKLLSMEAMPLLEATKESLFPWDTASSAKQVIALLEKLRATKHHCMSLAEHVRLSNERNGDFETTQRSGTCYYRCILSLFKYLLKADGMADDFGKQKRKQLFYAIRVGFLRVLQEHIANEVFAGTFEESDLKVVEIACSMTALAAVKEHKRGSIDLIGLQRAQELCEGTLQSAKAAMQRQLGPDSSPSGRCLQLENGCAQLAGFGNFEMLAALGEPFPVTFTGTMQEASSSPFVDLLHFADSVPKDDFKAAGGRLIECLEACKELRKKKAQESVKCMQIVSLIQHVCTATVQLPLPRGAPNCIWSGAQVTRAEQQQLLDTVDALLSIYAMAMFSSAYDRGTDSARIVTTGAIYSIFSCVAGLQATDGAFVESTVLAGFGFEREKKGEFDVSKFEAQAPFALCCAGFDKTSYTDLCNHLLLYSPHMLVARKATVEYFKSVQGLRSAFEFQYDKGHSHREPLRLSMDDQAMKFVEAVLQRRDINEAPPQMEKPLAWETSTKAQQMGAWIAASGSDPRFRLCAMFRDMTWKAKLCCLPSTAQLFDQNYSLPKMWTPLTCAPVFAYLGPGDHEALTACISVTTQGQRAIRVQQNGVQSKANAARFVKASTDATAAASMPIDPDAALEGAAALLAPILGALLKQLPEELLDEMKSNPSAALDTLENEMQGSGMPPELETLLIDMMFKKITGKSPPEKKLSGAVGGPIPTEEDVLFTDDLPTFGDSCREEESERIVSYLTVPSLAAPLLLAFFANERVGLLRNIELQMILEAVLFEPREFAPVCPTLSMVPEPASMLATPLGTLMHDAARVPDALLKPLLELCTSAADLCVGNYTSTFAELLLFLVRTAARLENIFDFVQTEERKAEWKPSADTAEHLLQLRAFLRETAAPVITIWMGQAQAEKNTPAATTCSMHLAMIYSGGSASLRDEDLAPFMSSIGFVVSWLSAPSAKPKVVSSEAFSFGATPTRSAVASRTDGLAVQPVHDVFALITRRRQQVVQWLADAEDADRDRVLSAVVSAALQGETPQDLDLAKTKGKPTVTRGWCHTKEKPLICSHVIETEHPHSPNSDRYWTVSFPGAAYLSLCFDERSRTEAYELGSAPSDYVTVYKDHTKTSAWAWNGVDKIAGTNPEAWPGVGGAGWTIPGDTCVVHFHCDGSNEEWGFQLNITAPIDTAAIPRLLKLPVLAEAGESEQVKTQAASLALVAMRNHGGPTRPALPYAEGVEGSLSADEYLAKNAAALIAQARKDMADVEAVGTVSGGEYTDPSGIVTCNVQTGEVFLRSRVQMPTPMSIASHPDFSDMFDTPPVCTIDSQLEQRQVVSIFDQGRKYSVAAWKPLLKPKASSLAWGGYPEVPLRCKPEVVDAADTSGTGAITWLGEVYEPYQVEGWPRQAGASPIEMDGAAAVRAVLDEQIKKIKMDLYPKMWLCKAKRSLLMYVAPIGSKQDRDGHMGQFFEVQVLRSDLAHVFALSESSRILHRHQVYSTDCRYALKRLQPDDEKRQSPPSRSTRHAAGPLWANMMAKGDTDLEFSSLTVSRNRVVTNAEILQSSIAERQATLWGAESPGADRSDSTAEWDIEIMVAVDQLEGLLPDAILEGYRFFKTGDCMLRGYPRDGTDPEKSLRVKLAKNGASALVYRDFCPQQLGEEPESVEALLDDEAVQGMVLLNPLTAAPESDLARIAALFARVENLSHVLCWSRSAHADLGEEVEITMVELPRLQLSFRCRNRRLYSLDHDGLFLAQKMDESVAKLVRHIPHALVLESNGGQRQVLVPSYELKRVTIGSCPLNSELVLTSSTPEEPDRWQTSNWCTFADSRFWLYPVHVSGSYLTTPSLSAALYLVLIMIMRRQYAEASKLLANCFTDTPLTREESWIVAMIASTAAQEEKDGAPDQHPDCVACRLKLAIVCYECGFSPSWDVSLDYSRFVQTYAHVSKACGLSVAEEEQLLGHCKNAQTRALYLKSVSQAAKSGEAIAVPYESNPEVIGGAKMALYLYGMSNTVLTSFQDCEIKYNQQCPPTKVAEGESAPKRLVSGDKAVALLRANEAGDDLNGKGKGLGFGLLWEIATGELVLDIGCGTQSKSLSKLMLGAMICKHTEKFDKDRLRGGQPEFVIPMALLCAPVHAALDDENKPEWPALPMSKIREGTSFSEIGEWKEKALTICKDYCTSSASVPFGNGETLAMFQTPDTVSTELKISPNTLSEMALPVPFDTAASERVLGSGVAASAFARAPLDELGIDAYVKPMNAIDSGDKTPLDKLPFEANDASVAGASLLARMRKDLDSSAKALTSSKIFRLKCLDPEHLKLLESDLMGGACVREVSSAVGGRARPMLRRQVSAGELTSNGQQVLKAALVQLQKLCDSAIKLKLTEQQAVSQESKIVLEQARDLTAEESDPKIVASKQLFYLQRLAGHQFSIRFDWLASLVLSSTAVGDLQRANPFISNAAAEEVLSAVSMVMFRVVRLGQLVSLINNIRSLMDSLKQLVSSRVQIEWGMRSSTISAATTPTPRLISHALEASGYEEQAGKELMESLLLAQDQLVGNVGGLLDKGVDASAALTVVFDYVNFDIQAAETLVKDDPSLVSTMLSLARRRCFYKGRALHSPAPSAHTAQVAAADPSSPAPPMMRKSTVMRIDDGAEELKLLASRVHKLRHQAQAVVSVLTAKRGYCDYAGSDGYTYDPRFLIVEFVSGFMLRKRQVQLVCDFIRDATSGKSRVEQMIMGQGKTTVIAPLLALMLADKKRLVVQVVPGKLLDMSREVMRTLFSVAIPKRIYTLNFDRSSNDLDAMEKLHAKLLQARACASIVVSSPDAVKSLELKYVELLASVEAANPLLSVPTERLGPMVQRVKQIGAELAANEAKADVLAKIIKLWGKEERGVALLDEVDMLLHPLRSELNFPIGPKGMLDCHSLRFSLPMHLLDAIFWCEGRPLSLEGFRPGQDAANALTAIRKEIDTGLKNLSLSRSPQLSLLDPAFYTRKGGMQDAFAQWALVWLTRNSHIQADEADTALQYVGTLESTLSAKLSAAIVKFSSETMKALNLARDWVTIFIPHTLSKVHRVGYGLLSKATLRNWKLAEGENYRPPPKSRQLLAVPFIALEAPSRNSEFAHPEVLIGLSILAYRYEGLRMADLKRIIRALKEEQNSQPGPFVERAASILFQSWVSIDNAGASINSSGDTEGEEEIILPLELFEHEDDEQMDSLLRRLSHNGLAINHYLLETVFPSTMQKQATKLQASGVDLGSDMLFGTRCGFSGTPSELLPRALRPCYYEPGSEAQIIRELTSPLYCSTEVFTAPSELPFVEALLRHVATSTQPNGQSYSSLIDTGALITGLGNEGCARSLLEYGLTGKSVCVFLDDMDRKMTVDRSLAKPRPLSQCGVPLKQRFVFYDQAHTTGMDIKHDLTAMAVTTVGKDTTLRDYAQGAYRMRGLAKGQLLHCLLIPTVLKLIQARGGSTGELLNDTIAWLVGKQIESEALQNTMLTKQNLESCWRLEAFHTLLGSSRVDGGNYIKVGDKQLSVFVNATFGPQTFNVNGLCAMGDPDKAQTPLLNNMKGKICLVRRGGAKFVNKAMMAQNAGAIGVLIINPSEDFGKIASMGDHGGGDDGIRGSDIQIPVLMVKHSMGELLLDSPGLIIQMKVGGDRCALLSRFREPVEDDAGISAALADKSGSIFSKKELEDLEEKVLEEKRETQLQSLKTKVTVAFTERDGDASTVYDAYNGHIEEYKKQNNEKMPSVAERMAFMEQVAEMLGVEVEKEPAPWTKEQKSARARENWARVRKVKGAIVGAVAFANPTNPEKRFRNHVDNLMASLGGDDVNAMLAESEEMPLEERIELFAAAVGEIDKEQLELDLAQLKELSAKASAHIGKERFDAKFRELQRKPLIARLVEMQKIVDAPPPAPPPSRTVTEEAQPKPASTAAGIGGMPVLQRQASLRAPQNPMLALQRALSQTMLDITPTKDEKSPVQAASGERLSQAVSLFREPLELSLSSLPPSSEPFSASLQTMLDEQRTFMESEVASSTAEQIVGEQRQAESNLVDAGAKTETKHFDGEVVQEQEQEQEQEQQQQQQQEVENSYARSVGSESAWPIESLTQRSDALLNAGSFFHSCDFRVVPSSKAVRYPRACLLSSSYAPRMHRADESRRLKNVEVLLYWRPMAPDPQEQVDTEGGGAGLAYIRGCRLSQVENLQDDADDSQALMRKASSRPGLQALMRKASATYLSQEAKADAAASLTKPTSAEEQEALMAQAASDKEKKEASADGTDASEVTGTEELRDADVDTMSVAQLRALITSSGHPKGFADCIEKSELRQRAKEALKNSQDALSLRPTPSGAPPPLYCCIISLKEAETLFRVASDEQAGAKLRPGQPSCTHPLVQFQTPNDGYGCDSCSTSVAEGAVMHGCRACNYDLCGACFTKHEEEKQAAAVAHSAPEMPRLALRTLEGMWLSVPMPEHQASSAESVAPSDLIAMLQCARFFDNQMQFTENEQIKVLESLKTTSAVDRRMNFEEVIGCRKRDSSSWEGKGVGGIFQYSDAVHLTRIRDLSSQVRSKMAGMGKSTAAIFAELDEDNTNWLSLERFQSALSKLDLNLPTDDVAELLHHVDQDHDGFLSFRDFATYFAMQSESSTEDRLAVRRRRRIMAQNKAAKKRAAQDQSVSGLEALEALARVEAAGDDGNTAAGSTKTSGAFDQSRIELIGTHFVYGDGAVSFGAEGRASADPGHCVSTSPWGCKLESGKFYFEVTLRTHAGEVLIGLGNEGFGVGLGKSIKCGNDAHSFGFDTSSGVIMHRGISIPSKGFPAPCRAGDTVGCYIDMDARTIAFTKNASRRSGLCIECAFPIALGAIIPVVTFDSSSHIQMNFGEYSFHYTPTVDGRAVGFRSIRHWQRETVESRHIREEQFRFAKIEGSSGQSDLTITHNDDGTVTAHNDGNGFPSAVLGGVLLTQGVWYWEFTVTNWPGRSWSKLFQIGWGDWLFSGDAHRAGVSKGCGDDKHSWGYDGGRAPREGMWANARAYDYGCEANVGDVVGCEVDLDRNILSWSLNGDFSGMMGSCSATENIEYMLGLTPALTLQGLTVVSSKCPFLFPPSFLCLFAIFAPNL
jgi:hypothetical protein